MYWNISARRLLATGMRVCSIRRGKAAAIFVHAACNSCIVKIVKERGYIPVTGLRRFKPAACSVLNISGGY
jgi:hypothetical protein